MKVKLVTIFFIVDISPISFYLDLKVKQNLVKHIIKLL